MTEERDYIDIPVIPEKHEWFMYVVKKFNVDVKIKNGFYRISYDNAIDLYEIGLQVSRQPQKDFVTNYGLPVK